jgi:hypothetical protein
MENPPEIPREEESDSEGSSSTFPTQKEPEDRDLPQEMEAIPAQLSPEDKVRIQSLCNHARNCGYPYWL